TSTTGNPFARSWLEFDNPHEGFQAVRKPGDPGRLRGDVMASEEAPAPPAEISDRQRLHTVVLCVLGWMFDHYDLMLCAYIASAIGKDWEWGEAFTTNKAFLLGIALFTSGVGGVVFGGLADRFGRRRVMGWTILIYSLSTGLSGLAVGLVSLAFLRALTGFGF